MYGGTVVESGPAKEVLARRGGAKHPYTAALLASVPDSANIDAEGRLPAIEGDVLDTITIPAGCRFYGRCGQVTDRIQERCERAEPELREAGPGHKVRCWLYVD
jgi:oligopeptide/dipeptide ABC transporter ATP-binding protein